VFVIIVTTFTSMATISALCVPNYPKLVWPVCAYFLAETVAMAVTCVIHIVMLVDIIRINFFPIPILFLDRIVEDTTSTVGKFAIVLLTSFMNS
jgi:hypothetical protein